MDIKKSIKDVAVLFVICTVFGTLLAAVNSITAPIIREKNNAAASGALLEVLPEGKNFEEITITDEFPAIVQKGWVAEGGSVFQMSVTGKNSGIIIMVGVNAEGKVVSSKVISHGETPEYAAKVWPHVEGDDSQYKDMTLDSFEPYLVGGATLTSDAYSQAIKAALQAAALAGGADVDTRTPEQILQDDCNEALGTKDVKFTRWFATEELLGVDKVYVAGDNSGYVFIIGESFIGVNADGVTTPEVSEENAATVTTAYAAVVASTLTEIEIPAGADKLVVIKAYVTESGNYVFELEGSGYADYGASYGGGRAPIYISISISSDGKIIDCVTTYHTESKGYGDKCATDEYRDGWVGVTNGDVVVSQDPDKVGVIAGATFTTEGYQKAVKAAFKAFELLTGGNE